MCMFDVWSVQIILPWDLRVHRISFRFSFSIVPSLALYSVCYLVLKIFSAKQNNTGSCPMHRTTAETISSQTELVGTIIQLDRLCWNTGEESFAQNRACNVFCILYYCNLSKIYCSIWSALLLVFFVQSNESRVRSCC